MAWDYGFGELENEIIEAAQELPPNFEKMQELLDRGADVNATSYLEEPCESVLSAILLGYRDMVLTDECHGCKKTSCSGCDKPLVRIGGVYLTEICRFFLQNGFNLQRCGGDVGSCCLQNLTWSSYDRYILDAAKVLLHAGANPDYRGDGCTLLEWVATKASAARCNDDDQVIECLFETMYSILEAAIEGRDYDAIEYPRLIMGGEMMRLRLNLSGVDVQLKISNWVEQCSDEDWSADWTNTELSLHSKYLNYDICSELLMSSEVSALSWMLDDLLSGELKEDTTMRFAEPDLSFRARMAKRLYSVPGKVSYRNGYMDVDIYLDMYVRFWCPDSLGSNYFCMVLDREEIKAMMIYLKTVIGELPPDALEVLSLVKKGILLTE